MIVYFCSIIIVVIAAMRPSIGVPKHLRDKFSSKSKFAKMFNAFCQKASFHKDYSFCIFYEIAIYVHAALFLLSTIIFVINLLTSDSIYYVLGNKGVLIICVIGFLLPLIYCSGIRIWWDFSKRQYERTMNE